MVMGFSQAASAPEARAFPPRRTSTRPSAFVRFPAPTSVTLTVPASMSVVTV